MPRSVSVVRPGVGGDHLSRFETLFVNRVLTILGDSLAGTFDRGGGFLKISIGKLYPPRIFRGLDYGNFVVR